MARLKKNLIIKEIEGVPTLLEVWAPTPAKAKKLIEAIGGVVRVNHFVDKGRLSVWFNPCYGKTELKAEIRAALSEQRWATSLHAQRERRRRHRTTRPYLTGRTIADMKLGEVGYVVPWAVDDWDWLSSHLDGLSLGYYVHPAPWGTIDTPIYRTKDGWIVGGKVFTEPKRDKHSRVPCGKKGLRKSKTVDKMGVGEWGYTSFGAVDENGLDKSYPVLHVPTETADLSIVRIDVGWVIGGKVFR